MLPLFQIWDVKEGMKKDIKIKGLQAIIDDWRVTRPIDLAVRPDINTFRGETNVELYIEGIRAAPK